MSQSTTSPRTGTAGTSGGTLRSLRQGALLGAFGLLVGVLGLFTGAFVMSPGVPPTQRLIGLAFLGAFAVVALLTKLFLMLGRRSRRRGSSRFTSPAVAGPSVSLRAGKTRRTPKAVVALAAAGAAPIEIARKTGLPVDAVAMLLQLGRAPVAA
jgi:hypothetical protein